VRTDPRILLSAPERYIGMERVFAVYILASRRNGTLYVGVTSELPKRVMEHRLGLVEGFTKEYDVKHLVWYEMHGEAVAAITRERQIKKWNRLWKLKLIEEKNPEWIDLYAEVCK
jgi:putative endonuclease